MPTAKQLANLSNGKELTSEEAARMGRAGGLRSAQVRRERKDIKEKIMLAIDVATDKLSDIENKKGNKRDAKDIKLVGADVYSIIKIAFSKDTKEEVRLKAIDMLMSYGYGRPKQSIEIEDNQETIIQDISQYHTDELLFLIKNVAKELVTVRKVDLQEYFEKEEVFTKNVN